MSGSSIWHSKSLTAIIVLLPACSDDAGSSDGRRDPEDAAIVSDASQLGTATAVEPNRSDSSNDNHSDSGRALDGGAQAPGDGGPIIGVIDPGEVDVVVVEAGAQPPAVCAPDQTRELKVAAQLPNGAIPLSVTPDGSTWAYALAAGAGRDAAASSSDVDAASEANPDAAASSAVRGGSSAIGTEPMDPEDAPVYSIHVVSADDEWVFTLSSDQDPLRGAALDATGSVLVTTLADTKGFVLWERDGDQFAIAEAQPFERLNALAQQGGVRFEKPVFSPSGTRLYAHEVRANTTITQLVLRDRQWETELRITDAALQAQQFSLSAVSVDELTLFGLSTADNHAVAWWRPTLTDAFDTSLVLDATPRAVSVDCREWWTVSTE